MTSLKPLLADILETHHSRLGRWGGVFLTGVILLSIIVFMLDTTYEGVYQHHFLKLDIFITIIFTLEYIARIYLAPRKARFIFSFLGLVDLFVLLAFYLTFFDVSFLDLAFLRGFRVFRIFQALKIVRSSELMLSFFRALWSRYYRDEIKIYFLTLVLVLFVSSSGFYYLEHQLNHEINDIFDSFWWSVVTITTVGYGDIVPSTVGGKIIAGFTAFCGLAATAIITALITKVFIDHFFGKRLHHCHRCQFPHHENDAKYCKNCGAPLDIEKLHSADQVEK